jgi:hypothetical protein
MNQSAYIMDDPSLESCYIFALLLNFTHMCLDCMLQDWPKIVSEICFLELLLEIRFEDLWGLAGRNMIQQGHV